MIEQLVIKNGYRHAHSVFDFKAGQTAITGKNESGKSVTLEMILFALWGSAALRGAADDYKKLEVTLTFIVKEMRYRITRTIRNAKLVRLLDDSELDVAVGTKPVNLKMREIFGYDFSVFTMANACLQGAVEELTKAKPADRKRVVDQTIGLNVLDDLAKFCGDQSLAFRRQAEGIASVLREPVQPVAPENYEPSSLLVLRRDECVRRATELHQLRGMIAHEPEQPVQPVCEVTETVETLQSLLNVRGQLLDARKLADSTATLLMREKTTLEAELLKLHDELKGESRTAKEIKRVTAEMNALMLPYMTIEQIETLELRWKQYDRWLQKKDLLSHGEHCCPACDHKWPVAHDMLHVFADVVEMEQPAHTRNDLSKQRALHLNIERKAEMEQTLIELEARLVTEKAELEAALVAKAKGIDAKQADIDANAKSITELVDCLTLNPDRSDDLKKRQAHDGALLAYVAQCEAYKRFYEKLEERKARIADLEPFEEALKPLEEQLVHARAYEQAQAAYEASVKSYEADKLKMDGLLEQAEDQANAKAAIVEAKSVIKSFLIPSLNKVASLLINQMTGGARSQVVIDDDFNITVDGQQVQTLSGSGKAVANLAIRIGLGQVLTNGVFSVFMADEFDESMDDERARYTAECLQRLKETVKQVIVVTHKRPIADHIFTLPLKAA